MVKKLSVILAGILICGTLSASAFKVYEYQKFTIPVKDIYKEKVVHYIVPDNYKEKTLPLIIFLHGGGPKSPAKAALTCCWDYAKNQYFGGVFTESGAVVAAPHSLNGWYNEDIGEYIADVIAECVKRYNIDTERVYLLGWSMGGRGAYYAMDHYPELFASITVLAGNGSGIHDFRKLGKAKAYLIYGKNDAIYKKRPHYTDVQYGLTAAELMKRDHISHMLLVNDGGHMACDHKEDLKKFWNDAKNLKRDLNYLYLSGTERNRGWITVEKYAPGTVSVDYIYSTGKCGSWRDWNFTEQQFNDFKVSAKKRKINGGKVEASYLGSNNFDIKTKNVAELTVRMNAQMVDYSKPMQITVNGKKMFSGLVKPDAKNAEDHAREYKLPGVQYDGKVTLKMP